MARQSHTATLAIVYTIASLISGAIAGAGLMQNVTAAVVAGFIGMLIVVLAATMTMLTQSKGSNADSGLADMLVHELRELRGAIDDLAQQSALSDDARRVLHRARERDLLRKAIEQDIAAQDWDAALVLCTELASRFGYREDAEGFRARIESARADTLERRINASIAGLDALIVDRDWPAARAEAARLRRLFPESPRTEGLRERVETARIAYKADLEGRFLTASSEERVEEAMALLKELDAYLTEAEAEPYREVARGIIGKARDNLGVQFKLAVRDKRWGDAARAGQQVIEQFPNTRMAEEIRGMLDHIRERARV